MLPQDLLRQSGSVVFGDHELAKAIGQLALRACRRGTSGFAHLRRAPERGDNAHRWYLAVAPAQWMMRRCLVCRGIAWCAGAGGGTLKRKMQIMRRVMGVVVLMALAASAASAQGIPGAGARPGNEIGTGSSLPLSDRASNIGPGDTRSSIAPNLPAPPVGEDAPVQAYLQAARSALIAGRTGEAQQALEMAETRTLDRSVSLFQTSTPSRNPLVDKIGQAREALGAHDRGRAVQIIDEALGHQGQ